MTTETKGASLQAPKNFFKVLFYRFTHHNGKLSKLKVVFLLLAFSYLIVQPWTIIRAALASSMTGFMMSNVTDNVLTAAVEAES